MRLSRIRFTFLFIFPALFAVLLGTGALTYSSFLTLIAEYNLDQWECRGTVSDDGEWQTQAENLNQAKKIEQFDANVSLDLGRLHEFRALSKPIWSDDAKISRKQSLDYYQEATTQRPTWALAWVNVAQARLLNQQIDKETFDAMRKAFQYGRWQEKVQQRLIWLGVGMWSVLPVDLKDEIRAVVRQTLEQDYRVYGLIVLAYRQKWEGELKKLVTRKEHWEIIRRIEKNGNELNEYLRKQQARKC